MKETINLFIPLGYRLDEKVDTVSLSKGAKILRTRKAGLYTKAERGGEEIKLYSKWISCPYCGKKYPANANFQNLLKGGKDLVKPPKATVDDWLNTCGKELAIVPEIEAPKKFVCPNCDNETYPSNAERQVAVMIDGEKVSVKCAIIQIDEMLSLGKMNIKGAKINTQLFEKVTFDLGRGRVYSKIEYADGGVIAIRDVTNNPNRLAGGAVYKLLEKNKLVVRNVRRYFLKIWKTPLPYTYRQTSVSELFNMARFVGYPKSFYNCIPYERASLKIDESFLKIARNMHRAQRVVEIFERSKIPNVKSIRRIMFSNLGLFFYTSEIEKLWNAIKDYNVLARMLARYDVYEILSSIQMRPVIFMYIKDYCQAKGAANFLYSIGNGWYKIKNTAIHYCCVNERMRKNYFKNQKVNNLCGFEEFAAEAIYAVPMCKPNEHIKECRINGYTFAWLRNSNDYVAAAKDLSNCLGDWRQYCDPVIGVKRKGEYVAAIEISGNKVIQARSYDNGPLSQMPRLEEAFKKWMVMFGLENKKAKTANFDNYVFDDADMPF